MDLVHREALHFVGLRLQEEGRAANEKTKHELEDMPTQRVPLVLLEPSHKHALDLPGGDDHATEESGPVVPSHHRSDLRSVMPVGFQVLRQEGQRRRVLKDIDADTHRDGHNQKNGGRPCVLAVYRHLREQHATARPLR